MEVQMFSTIIMTGIAMLTFLGGITLYVFSIRQDVAVLKAEFKGMRESFEKMERANEKRDEREMKLLQVIVATQSYLQSRGPGGTGIHPSINE